MADRLTSYPRRPDGSSQMTTRFFLVQQADGSFPTKQEAYPLGPDGRTVDLEAVVFVNANGEFLPMDAFITSSFVQTLLTAADAAAFRAGIDVPSNAEMVTAVNDAVNSILDGAPANLDTLNELAAALADDANFAATVTAFITTIRDANINVALSPFNAPGNDTDQTTTIQTAYDSLSAGGCLNFKRGSYRVALEAPDRDVNIRGESRRSSILKPVTDDGCVLQLDYGFSDVYGPNIADMGFVGTGTAEGTGIRTGSVPFTNNDEYITHGTFERLDMRNLDKAFHRPYGNIGYTFRDCVFFDNNYGVFTEGNVGDGGATSDAMHAGCLTICGGQIQRSNKAGIYIDGNNVVGCGMVCIEDVIFESNEGWLFYIKDFNDRDRVPTGVVRNCWNESNYTAVSVDVEGDVGAPKFAYISNTPHWIFENTPIGPMEIKSGSQVLTRDCSLDGLTSLDMDSDCTLVHEDARQFTGTPYGLVVSIGFVENVDSDNLNTPWFPMPPPKTLRGLDPTKVLLVSHAQAAENWTGAALIGTSNITDDPALPILPNVQQLTCTNTGNMYPTTAFNYPSGVNWILTQVVIRHVSGTVTGSKPLGGDAGRGGPSVNRETAWRTMTSIVRSDAASAGSNFLLHTVGSNSVFRFAGYAVTVWSSYQEALAFANSGAFPFKADAPPHPLLGKNNVWTGTQQFDGAVTCRGGLIVNPAAAPQTVTMGAVVTFSRESSGALTIATNAANIILNPADRLQMASLSKLTDAADDTAAASAGVAVNEFYRTGSIVKIRAA